MNITPLYAALLAFLFLTLSFRTIKLRREYKIAVGHGNKKSLERAIRAHANFAEYVPFSLLLIVMLESLTRLPWLIHLLGMALVISRVIHAYGISQADENIRYRVFGMATTFTVLGISAFSLLVSLMIKWAY